MYHFLSSLHTLAMIAIMIGFAYRYTLYSEKVGRHVLIIENLLNIYISTIFSLSFTSVCPSWSGQQKQCKCMQWKYTGLGKASHIFTIVSRPYCKMLLHKQSQSMMND